MFTKILQLLGRMVFLGLLCNPTIIYADDELKLKKVLREISSVKSDLRKKQLQQQSVQGELHGLDKKLKNVQSNLSKTTNKLNKEKQVLKKLARDQIKEESKLTDAQNKLLAQIKVSYKKSSMDRWQDLFMEPEKISSQVIFFYHQSIMQKRLDQMRSIKQIISFLVSNKKKSKVQTVKLTKLEKQHSLDKIELETVKKQRANDLNLLKNKINLQSKKLDKLLAAKRRLEQLIDQLHLNRSQVAPHEASHRFCRNFVWPTKGKIVTHFGSAIEQSSWQWNGVIIRGEFNQDVHAISSGKVVYADRLTGYGKLLIIDHGNGYMSLYGYNNRLHKQKGDSVVAGDLITGIGKSTSGADELYFAIRYNGKAIDPEISCR